MEQKLLKCLIQVSLFMLVLSHYETPFKQQIANTDMYTFSWAVNPEDGLIKFEMDVGIKGGWIAFGISPDGTMINSDMYIGYIKKDGSVILSDRYAQTKSLPSSDIVLGGTDDIMNITGSVEGMRMKISFVRKLNTKDIFDVEIKQGQSYNLIFAYREKGNPETEGEFLIHSGKYNKQFVLYPFAGQKTQGESLAEKYKSDPNIKSTKVTMDNYQVLADSTSYVCRLFNINKIISNSNLNHKKDTSYHAIGFEPVIDNEAIVHHMIVFKCDYRNVFYEDKVARCEDLPKDCFQTTFGWAVGQRNFEFPEEAGLLWGTFETYFVVLQLHYNNPTGLLNQKDSSGFNVFYTPKLRKYDIGVTMIGPITSGIEIPPNNPSYSVEKGCPAKCTKQLPKEGFNIALHSYHAHMLGRKIIGTVTKPDGSVDSTTFREDNYDFNHQKIITTATDGYYKFLPGSSFSVKCIYDSTGKTSVTQGGQGSNDEMCLIYVYYFPIENGLKLCIEGKEASDEPICVLNSKPERIEGSWAASSHYYKVLIQMIILTLLCFGM